MSTESTTPPALELSAAERCTEKLNDFSDRLPPMMVKELRQGLRAKTFVAVFLGLQLFLGIVMLFATAASGMATAGEAVSQIIFLFFSLAVLVVQPLRAMNSLHGEIKSTTIDMMVLTRLNARRIVAGKWAAIVGQTLLLFISIIPYLILRYFFGGMNLFAELLALGTVFLASAGLTAINVGLSSNPAIVVRGIVPLIIALFMFSATMGIMDEFEDFLEFFAMADAEQVGYYLAFLLGGLYLAWITFGIGVTAIAPLAENHTTLNRLVTLGVMALVLLILVAIDFSDPEAIPFIIGAVALPAIIMALTEGNYLMSRVAQPFVRRGFAGKAAGLFLYPCWTSGVHFTALVSLLVLAIGAATTLMRSGMRFGAEEFTVLCSLTGSLLLPGILVAWFYQKIQNRLGFYLVALIASYCLTLSLIAVAESTDAEHLVWIFAWLSPVHLYMVNSSAFDETPVLLTSLICTCCYLGILLIQAWKRYPTIRQAEQQVQEASEAPAHE